ncbi:MAG: dienelactone hydrolase family protein [Xanthobacteraceae bacterium]
MRASFKAKFVLPTLAFCASLALLPAGAGAQTPGDRVLAAASQARDLDLPQSPSPLPAVPRMGLFKPDGAGPFPALVLHHQCGGLRRGKWQNESMLEWAREAVKRGYVVLLLDSLSARGVDTVCMGPKSGVNPHRGARDALQAATHLRKFDFVDRNRIAHAGYSWGAMVGLLANTALYRSTLNAGEGFNAHASFYPGCFTIKPPKGPSFEIVRPDIRRAHLVLMGDKDTETPAAECVAKLSGAKAKGSPVEWHVYPDATHCWDCKNLDGRSKTDIRGNHVVYRYDAKVTADSAKRMFEFLDRTWRGN